MQLAVAIAAGGVTYSIHGVLGNNPQHFCLRCHDLCQTRGIFDLLHLVVAPLLHLLLKVCFRIRTSHYLVAMNFS